MKATFLGHGFINKKESNVGKQLVASLKSGHYNSFNGFVAFASISGVQMLLPYIKKVKPKFECLRFFIGVDNKGTSKEALELMLNENIETYIYYDIKNSITYHPKLFLFEGKKFRRVIIGSSNLTSQGIKSNIEASIQIDITSMKDRQGNKLLGEIKDYYSELLNLSSSKIRLLTDNLLKELIDKDMLYTQFGLHNKKNEQKNNDGENNREQSSLELNSYEIETGFKQKSSNYSDKKVTFGPNDYERFDIIFKRYINYKNTKKPSGIVNKNTEDRELFYWYRKMNELYNNNSLPTEIFDKLINVDFPFDGIGRERKKILNFNKNFEILIEYKNAINPNSKYTYVPQFKDKSNKYYKLGIWCAYQKQRRKGNKNYPPKWTKYEEDKMNSINYVWENNSEILKKSPKDDYWIYNLVKLEEFYNKKNNFRTVPSQKTKIGKWLNDQMTYKLRQDKNNTINIMSEVRIEMLGNLLGKNGVEWEWEKQKHRIAIENKIQSWKIVKELTEKGQIQEFRINNKDKLKKYRTDIVQLKSQSKKWNNEKNQWKLKMLDKVGFPYNKQK